MSASKKHNICLQGLLISIKDNLNILHWHYWIWEHQLNIDPKILQIYRFELLQDNITLSGHVRSRSQFQKVRHFTYWSAEIYLFIYLNLQNGGHIHLQIGQCHVKNGHGGTEWSSKRADKRSGDTPGMGRETTPSKFYSR